MNNPSNSKRLIQPKQVRLSFRVLGVLVVLVTSFLLLEICLRLAPQLIPVPLLVTFNSDLRSRIAERLGLPTDRNTRLLPRDDGGPPGKMRVFQPGAIVRYRFDDPGIVNEVVMDENGFCNESAPVPGQAPVPVVALGDSFTWCMGVNPEDTWVSHLQADLGVLTYNLGVIAVGPYEYLQVLKKFGLPLSPEVVILNIYEGNDLRDAAAFHEYRAFTEGRDYEVAGVAEEREGSYGKRIRRWIKERPLARHSYAYNLTVCIIRAARRRLLQTEERGEEGNEAREPNFRYKIRWPKLEIAFNPANTDVDEVQAVLDFRAGEVTPQLWEASLRQFVDLSRRHRFIPIVAYTPSAHTAYADFVRFEEASLADLLGSFSRKQRRYLRDLAPEISYTFLDLTPALVQAARHGGPEGLLYFRSNLHLTRAGHRVVARALAEGLRREGLFEQNRPTREAPTPAPQPK